MIRRPIHLALACLLVVAALQPASAAAPARKPGDQVPAQTPANPGVAAHEQTTAQQLLKRDSHVRGRLTHAHGYAARQQSAIHQEREEYLRRQAAPLP